MRAVRVARHHARTNSDMKGKKPSTSHCKLKRKRRGNFNFRCRLSPYGDFFFFPCRKGEKKHPYGVQIKFIIISKWFMLLLARCQLSRPSLMPRLFVFIARLFCSFRRFFLFLFLSISFASALPLLAPLPLSASNDYQSTGDSLRLRFIRASPGIDKFPFAGRDAQTARYRETFGAARSSSDIYLPILLPVKFRTHWTQWAPFDL